MKPSDIARLSQPFPGGPDRSGRAPTAALGVEIPAWDTLEERIFADLTGDVPYGVGWWAPHPGTSRRILISDQLYACTASVSTNLVEAGIHLLELVDAIEREDDFQADAIQIVGGTPTMRLRPRRTPLEVLGPEIVRMQEAGVARALSGALDCAAGSIIGVMALPKNILRADFMGVVLYLRNRKNWQQTEGDDYQRAFLADLNAMIENSGPTGWFDWLLNFRNMLVHRGRRIEIGQFLPREPVVLDERGQPILRARVVTHLPLQPERSDVDIHREPNLPPVLTEDSRQTLDGAMSSVRNLLEALGERLTAAWDWRKANPAVLTQPQQQWPDLAPPSAGQPQGFVGYAPGSLPYEPEQLTSHPRIGHRMLAAALYDHQRGQWPNFD
jgi:hypothetical protein